MSQPLLSASSIFDAVDLAEEIVPVPEWGGDIRLQQMSAAESQAFTDEMSTIQGANDGIYLMLVYCAKDVEGKRLFTPEDVVKLKTKSMNVLNRLQRIALKLNKMGMEEQAALKKD